MKENRDKEKTLLLIIDCQSAFINENTKQYVSKIENLVKENKYDYVAFTKYINNENSMFFKNLNYKRCINEDDRKIIINTNNFKIFEKDIYSTFNNELEEYLKENEIDTIYLCGFDTEACVLKTALDLFENRYNVVVLKDYSMSNSGIDYHKWALKIIKKLIGENGVI